ncbi:MAG: hypothetical protein ACLTGJ_02580 [Faecalibacterium prausnitzii]
MGKLLELLEKLVRAIFGPGDKQDTGESEPAPQAPGAEAVTGWQGGPPYRFVDVSRYQGLIDWAQVAAAGYKGAMIRAVSTNRKLSSGQTACISTRPLRPTTATQKLRVWT